MLNGILPIDKPEDFTSFDVIAKLRGVTHTKKIGHSGTLDPMATGVLPLFFGDATKACSVLQNEDKRYSAELRLGITTDTEDITGKILSKSISEVTEEQFRKAAAAFVGKQMQTPPMYSAVKVDGRPLYDLARKGREVERPAKEITVYAIDVTEFCEAEQTAKIEVACGKGTYIRTLIADIGRVLGCGAAMTKLRRTEAGGFAIKECYTIAEVQEMEKNGTLEAALLPVERLFDRLPKLILCDFDAHLYKNGVPLELKKRGWGGINGDIAVFDRCENFLGISRMDEEENELKLRKLFYRG